MSLFYSMSYANGTWAQVGTAAADATAHNDTTVLANTPYSYRVRATNASGNSAWSNIASTRTGVAGSGTEVGDGIAGSGEQESEVGGQRSEIGNTGTDNGIRLTLSWAEPVAVLGGGGIPAADEPLPAAGMPPLPAPSSSLPAPSSPLLTWTSREGATYAIEFTPSLDQAFGLLIDGLPATPPVNTFRLPADTPEGFFRIVER